MCSAKKGVSAHQLHRTLGITYKSAWFLCHRVRKAMEKEPMQAKLSCIVEADETFVGGKKRGLDAKAPHKGKTVVFTLIQRDGKPAPRWSRTSRRRP
jgi:molybdenum-dependent DNA-binding transcriptional regulator ModE